MIEFAVCLPVLLLIVTGIFTYGIAINNYLLLTEATNVAARQLALSSGQTTDPCAATAKIVYAAAPTLDPGALKFGLVLNGVAHDGVTCSSDSTTTGAAADLLSGKNAKVTVTYPCSLRVYGISYVPDCSLQAQTTELVQ